ncbi:carbohydrate kinase [Virgibacillus doumboii]|uniref:carbohydrate kinase n=1 Tax=Virgibacillus doumboii TaxID=2697503 RepID=UPI0013DF6D71|nr:carbohydrate kinase [Virgibacillus doumboii]
MNEKEQKIVELIKQNPYISQQELAESLGLSRPSIANLISGLVKKGYIRGKAYVLNDLKQILCIGGANVDRKFYIKDKLQLGTSNPIRSTQTTGGVARNIAENLGRLGMDATLLTVSGSDTEWNYIAEKSSPYMNLDEVAQFSNTSTGSYTAVLDESGDLVLGLADMDVFDLMIPEWIGQHTALLHQAKCILADLNCPKDTLLFLCQFAKKRDIPLIFVAVSAPKMKHIPDELDGLTWMITNLDESEAYFDNKLTPQEAVEKWLESGVVNAVVTNGKEGAVVGNEKEGIYHVPALETSEIVDVTGAGDAFSSAVTYAWFEGKSLVDSTRAGIVNAAKTLQSTHTVRQDLSPLKLEEDMEELS